MSWGSLESSHQGNIVFERELMSLKCHYTFLSRSRFSAWMFFKKSQVTVTAVSLSASLS